MSPTLRLLYAEDNSLDADLTRSHFAAHAPEFEIEIVGSGQACLERLRQVAFDLLLLDYRLPDMDGLGLLKALAQAGAQVPVVFVTGDGDEELVVKALRLGAASYVSKRINYQETLPALLHAVLEEHGRKQDEGLPAAPAVRRILYVKHLPTDIELTLSHLAEVAPHLAVDVVHTTPTALDRLAQPHAYDLVLIDLQMPEQSGLDLVNEAKRRGLRLPPFLMISDKGDEASAVAVMRLGAADFVSKHEGYLDQLPYRIDRAIAHDQLNSLNENLRAELAERKRAEKARQLTAEVLNQSNEEVRQFAYIVSHDLRAPLVNFRGFVSELRRSLANLDRLLQPAIKQFGAAERVTADRIFRQELPESLEFIDSSVIRMDHLITSLLRLSRLGRHEPVPVRLDLARLVSDILASLGTQIKAGGTTVIVHPLPEITADRISLEQILSNILTNAVLYLDPARPGRIEITGELAEAELLLKVSDNGRGIAQDDREKVFAPLRRAGAHNVPGEGMGLAYVQALVRHQGGRIWFESEHGVGTTFSFVLPVVCS